MSIALNNRRKYVEMWFFASADIYVNVYRDGMVGYFWNHVISDVSNMAYEKPMHAEPFNKPYQHSLISHAIKWHQPYSDWHFNYHSGVLSIMDLKVRPYNYEFVHARYCIQLTVEMATVEIILTWVC